VNEVDADGWGSMPSARNTYQSVKSPYCWRSHLGCDVLSYRILLTGVPLSTAYSDDYPHAKFCVACLEDTTDVDLKSQEVPIEAIDSGKTSFTTLHFPDNYFDLVISG
jgi:hypothetical protein